MITARARKLRRNETRSEKALRRWLRDRRMCGVKFRRQHPVPPYFLDWACVELKLGLELDGGIHEEKVEYDEGRDECLRRRKWKILRIKSDDVEFRLHAVLDFICLAIETRRRELEQRALSPHPDPLPARGEGDG